MGVPPPLGETCHWLMGPTGEPSLVRRTPPPVQAGQARPGQITSIAVFVQYSRVSISLKIRYFPGYKPCCVIVLMFLWVHAKCSLLLLVFGWVGGGKGSISPFSGFVSPFSCFVSIDFSVLM